jgi:hypothetical protein
VPPPPASWRCAQVGRAREADERGSRGGGGSGRGHGRSLPSLAKCTDGEVLGEGGPAGGGIWCGLGLGF